MYVYMLYRSSVLYLYLCIRVIGCGVGRENLLSDNFLEGGIVIWDWAWNSERNEAQTITPKVRVPNNHSLGIEGLIY